MMDAPQVLEFPDWISAYAAWQAHACVYLGAGVPCQHIYAWVCACCGQPTAESGDGMEHARTDAGVCPACLLVAAGEL